MSAARKSCQGYRRKISREFPFIFVNEIETQVLSVEWNAAIYAQVTCGGKGSNGRRRPPLSGKKRCDRDADNDRDQTRNQHRQQRAFAFSGRSASARSLAACVQTVIAFDHWCPLTETRPATDFSEQLMERAPPPYAVQNGSDHGLTFRLKDIFFIYLFGSLDKGKCDDRDPRYRRLSAKDRVP